MRALGPWSLFALLLALALAAGLAVGARGDVDSPTLSAQNSGPHGARVLIDWLRVGGAQVDVATERGPLPPGTASLVLPAPTASTVTADEARAWLAFARDGGTVVLLMPRERKQAALEDVFHLAEGDPVGPSGDVLEDPAGVVAPVLVAGSLVGELKTLRVGAGPQLRGTDDAWVVAAGRGALLWRKEGAGEVWAAAGPELAQNQRLELGDNAAFWARLAHRGPLRFDESHHRLEAPVKLSANLVAVTLQLLFCAAVFVAARGARLGPPRPTQAGEHRSALEYVEAVAALTQNAHAEGEVASALRAGLRTTVRERLGLPEGLSDQDLTGELQRHLNLEAHELAGLFSPSDVLAVSRAVALVEARLAGRR